MASSPKILVIRRRYLGDVVLLGSLFRNLKLHWPDGRVVAAVEPGYAGILGLNPDVDAVVSPPAGRFAWLGFVRLIARLSGAPFRLALHHGDHPLRLAGLYTHRVHDPAAEHENHPITDYYLKALPAAGVPVVTREIRIEPRTADVAEWRRYVGAQGQVLLVHPGSRSPMRIWPAERFAAVCDRVQDELGAQVVLVGGPGDRDRVAQIQGLAKTHVIPP
jgi:ADP-heptose:LPS heptosyltransferase